MAELFAKRLAELRVKAGLTQTALAQKAGISQQAISNWEEGHREPSWSNVVALAEALGVDCSAFLEKPKTVTRPGRGRPRKDQAD